jgi:probable DNA repair protein
MAAMTPVIPKLSPDEVLLTANRRLARQLTCEQLSHQDSDKQISPNVFALNDWLKQLWERIGERAIISATGALLEMEALIRAQPTKEDEPQWLATRSLAELTLSALNTLLRWQYPIEQPQAEHCVAEFISTCQWCQRFQERLKDKHFIIEAEIASQLYRHPQLLDSCQSVKTLYLYGFQSLTPDTQQLLDRLSEQITVIQLPLPQQNTQVGRHSFRDSKEEIKQMAAYCYRQWQSDSHSRIACVVPDLTQLRPEIERIFLEQFKAHPQAFNISAGIPLSHTALVCGALQILSSDPQPSKTHIQSLLTDPKICFSSQDRSLAAQLSSQLNQPQKSPTLHQQILALGEALQPNYPKSLVISQLTQWLQAINNRPKYATLAQWVTQFFTELNAIGWCAHSPFNSIEHQQYEHWQQVLDAFARLGSLQPQEFEHGAALSILQVMARQHIFQAKTAHARVQILGSLEAVGLTFDHVWMMGLDSDHWPPPAKPHPLIPHQLQQQQKMPHASANQELNYSLWLTNACIQAAKTARLSSCQFQGEKTLMPSPIINQYPEIAVNRQLHPHEPLSASIGTWQDDKAPPIQANEKIRGGTSILQRQANCPFMAFAQTRLKAEPLEMHTVGLDPRDKGQLLHRVLALLWQAVGEQKNLLALHPDDLDLKLNQHIDQAIQEQFGNMQTLFLAVEKSRLQATIKQWLQHEKNRPPFKVVAVEKTEHININGLNLRYTIDRQDKLDNGSSLVIDYKSSKQNLGGWFHQPLSSPQMPLYTLSQQANAVAFAELKRGQMGFKGISQNSCDIPGIQTLDRCKYSENNDWAAQLKSWQQQLNTLSLQFQQGEAYVRPHEESRPCQYCELQLLCRIQP